MADRTKDSTCVSVQFNGPRRILALVVDHLDDNDFASRIVEVVVPSGEDALRAETLIDYEGWITTFWRDPHNRFFVGTSDGEIFIYSTDNFLEFDPTERAFSKLLGISSNEVYATTLSGSVFAWDGREWHDLLTQSTIALLDLTMDARGRLFASGEAGLLLVRENNAWRALDLHTNLRLGGVRALKDAVFVAGDRGICFRLGEGDEATPITGSESNAYGFAQFRGTVYAACSGDGIMTVKNDSFEPFSTILLPYGIEACDDLLAAFGGAKLAVFDSLSWRMIALA